MPSDAEGEAAVHRARRAVVRALGGTAGALPPPSPAFDEPRGVFVTLRRYPDGALRGCIGFPLPRFPLGEAIDRAARSAALDDPRFPPLRPAELGSLDVEVSVLTVPAALPFGPPEEAIAAVRVGVDGLIVEAPGAGGLLLPQVAPEQGWDAARFLDGVCEKAGLPRGAWRSPPVRIYRFQAEVFAETRPDGPVERRPPPVTPPAGRRAPRT